MIILKVTKNQGFILFLEDTFFEKPQGLVKLTPPAVLDLRLYQSFNQVWHSSLLSNLQDYGVERVSLALLKGYLDNRHQRVVLNGHTSERRKINSRVSQGSVLEPLLFLIFINGPPDGITICKVFADETSRSAFTK